jgi:ABC-2 type transport system ATP-binding protein
MTANDTYAIEIRGLARRYGRVDAVNGLDLAVRPGSCYGFFGRNGAGKTTTIKCLLNLLRPQSGSVRVFGLDPLKQDVEIKSRIAYVPDVVAFYPWMTVRDVLDYNASFRARWNRDIESDLLERFGLNPTHQACDLSKGQKTQLALISAVAPEPEMLVLDEPTSGLDPIVRREFIETVIGAYQSGGPEARTVFVSTHLISEFEGLIDDFTIIEQGKALMTLSADDARARFKKIQVRLTEAGPVPSIPGALQVRQNGRELDILVDGSSEQVMAQVQTLHPEAVRCESLSLEEIFVASKILSSARA